MNIFFTDINPQLSALALDDLRVNKMATETAQLLSTAIRVKGEFGDQDMKIYQVFGLNHPCNLWARHSKDNFSWLVQHGIALCNEHEFRKGNRHAALDVILECVKLCSCIPEGPLYTPPNCTVFRRYHHPIIAYRHALNWKWYHAKKAAQWTNRTPPKWYVPVGAALMKPDTEEEIQNIPPDVWERKMFKELSKDPNMAKFIQTSSGSEDDGSVRSDESSQQDSGSN